MAATNAKPRPKLASWWRAEIAVCASALCGALMALIAPLHFAALIAGCAVVALVLIVRLIRTVDLGWSGITLDALVLSTCAVLTLAAAIVANTGITLSSTHLVWATTAICLNTASACAIRMAPRTWTINKSEAAALVTACLAGVSAWLMMLAYSMLVIDWLLYAARGALALMAVTTASFAALRVRRPLRGRATASVSPQPSPITMLCTVGTGLYMVYVFTTSAQVHYLPFYLGCFFIVCTALARQAVVGWDYTNTLKSLAAREEHFRSMVQNSHDVVVICDPETKVITYSSHATLWQTAPGDTLTEMPLATALGLPEADVDHFIDRLSPGQKPRRLYGTVAGLTMEAVAQCWEGQILVTIRDVSEREKLRQSLHDLAFQDQLTGLPNRRSMLELLQSRIDQAVQTTAVLFIDLDRFKQVNDTAGHEAGDQVLREVASRLRVVAEGTTSLGRLGGDEFIAVVDTAEFVPKALAKQICHALSEPFLCQGRPYQLGASVGIAFTEATLSPSEVLRRADIAMYSAKRNQRNYSEYVPDLTTAAITGARRDATVAQALRDQALELHLQPIVDLRTHQVTGVESLLRWQDSQGHIRSPQPLLNYAARSGRMHEVSSWVLERSLATLATAGEQISIAINVPPTDLLDPKFALRFEQLLSASAVAPQRVVIEITENEVIEQAQRATKVLDVLHEIGVRIMVDDFGSGFSSLSYLIDLPIDGLKIDRKFISALPTRPAARSIVRALATLADENSLALVAEGVQCPEEAHWVRVLGAPMVQGFYFARPQLAATCGDLTDLSAWAGSARQRTLAVTLPKDSPVAVATEVTTKSNITKP